MKVIIANLNSKYIHSSLAPWYLSESIKRSCSEEISVQVVEGTINEEIEIVAKKIISKSPDVIGFCCYIWNIQRIYILIDLVKKALPKATIILGGPEVSYNPEQILKNNPGVDFIISGEGEKPIADLVTALYENSDYSFTEGLCFKRNRDIIVSEPYVSDTDPISPFCDEYFNTLNGRIAYIETSRGCPFSCAFCLSSGCSSVRFFNLERCKSEILKLSKSGTRTIKFVDRTFNANSKRANEIIEFIIENYGKEIPEDICFHFEIAGDILTDETVSLLGNAPSGLFQLEIGLQSFNEKTLEYVNRKTDSSVLTENIKLLLENSNIHIHIDLIAGLPLEDYESFRESFNRAYGLKPHMLQLGFLKLLHGTSMRIDTEKYKCEYNQNPPYEVISTPCMSRKDLDKLHAVEDSFERIYNSGRFVNTVDYIMKASKLTPFDVFEKAALFMASRNTEKISLDNYTNLLFDFFRHINGVNISVLRDKMIVDRLTTNPSGVIPEKLKIKDKRLKSIAVNLEKNINTERKKGIKRSIAILYSEHKAIYVDYDVKNKVTGRYKLNYIDTVRLSEEPDKIY